MNKRKKFTPADKDQIVLEVLREEETLAAIAKKYDVCQQLISRWKSEFLDNMATVFDKKNNETANRKSSATKGCQFSSTPYIDYIKTLETVRISMDGRGRATDNIMIERFFRSYKWERLYPLRLETVREVKEMTVEYMEQYNYSDN